MEQVVENQYSAKTLAGLLGMTEKALIAFVSLFVLAFLTTYIYSKVFDMPENALSKLFSSYVVILISLLLVFNEHYSIAAVLAVSSLIFLYYAETIIGWISKLISKLRGNTSNQDDTTLEGNKGQQDTTDEGNKAQQDTTDEGNKAQQDTTLEDNKAQQDTTLEDNKAQQDTTDEGNKAQQDTTLEGNKAQQDTTLEGNKAQQNTTLEGQQNATGQQDTTGKGKGKKKRVLK